MTNAQKLTFVALLTAALVSNPGLALATDSYHKDSDKDKEISNNKDKDQHVEKHDDQEYSKKTVYVVSPKKEDHDKDENYKKEVKDDNKNKDYNNKPCASPTAKPTVKPTEKPKYTPKPTATPTVAPTATPIAAPTIVQVTVNNITNTPAQGTPQVVTADIKPVAVSALAFTGKDQTALPIILGSVSILFGIIILKRLFSYNSGLK